MSEILSFFKQVTLGKLLVLLSAFSIALAFILILVLSGIVRNRAIHDLARNDARQTSRLVFESLYSAMRKGWNKGDIKEVTKRLNQSMPGLMINVYRGEIVDHQFGEIPGEHATVAADPDLKYALRSGQDLLLIKAEGKFIRYLYPVLAQVECLVCHTESHVGAVQGVIDITYPIDNLKVSFNYVIHTLIGYTLLIMVLVFSILYFRLRNLVVLPIAGMVDLMQRITKDMNFNHRISNNHWIAELHHLTDYFNRLLSTVQDYSTRLQELSVRDPLTGLYNRRKFEEFLNYEINRAERHQRSFSVIMVDLDCFKFVNDTYGHPIGDIVLKELAALLTSNLRRGDVLARLGGDEFALILPETASDKGFQVASKLHQALRDQLFELGDVKIQVTASFSIVSYPEDGQTKEAIYSAMDVMLYKAKRHGKNLVMTTGFDENGSMMEVFRRGDFLLKAIHEDRIEAFMQPIIDMRTGKVVAFESLARIRDGDKVIPAEEFIEVSEELGMACELDQIVFNKGLSHLCKIRVKNPGIKMFFNLSAHSFNNLKWMRTIPSLAQQSGVTCESIVLEITEREALPHLNKVKEVIDDLRQSKIEFALDDFGSGFSSFIYLKYLAVDYVKIDGSFVRHIALDDRDHIMVRHIHQIAKEFGLKTVAEYVEDEETAKILMGIGVDFAQGYYHGRPKCLPEIIEAIETES